VDVDAVGDDLGVDAVVEQHSARRAGIAVVQALHTVEGVRRLAQAAIGGSGDAGDICAGVAQGKLDALADAGLDQLQRAVKLRGNSHQPGDAAGEPHAIFGGIGRPQMVRRLGALVLDVQVRAFQMNAQMGRAVCRLRAGADVLDGGGGVRLRGGHRRGQVGGDAMSGEVAGHAMEGRGGRIHGVAPVRAVDMDVDQARRNRQAVSRDDGIAGPGFAWTSDDGGDAPRFDDQSVAFQGFVRGDDRAAANDGAHPQAPPVGVPV